MKILYLLPTLNTGGAEKLVLNSVEKLRVNNGIFVFSLSNDNKSTFINKLSEFGVKSIFLNKKRRISPKTFFGLFMLIKSFKPSIIHSHLNSLKYLLFSLIFNNKIKYFHTIHNQPEKDAQGLEKVIIKTFIKIFKIKLVSLSTLIVEKVSFFYSTKNVIALNNGIDYKHYVFNDDFRKKLSHQYYINEKTFVIGHVRRFLPQKNHIFLLKIIRDINLSYPSMNFVLILIGSGYLKSQIAEFVNNNSLSSKVILIDNTIETNQFYSLFDVFLLPSLFEGFPLELVEAQVSNLTCIISSNIDQEAIISNKVIRIDNLSSTIKWVKALTKIYQTNYFARNSNIHNRLTISALSEKLMEIYNLK
jgi:glycosyltransferase involved in cell wall biosynthesis